jgi:tRNA (cytidine32/uridine32-2'-O)-methyltransferase
MILDNIRIVLVGTTHNGNIGAAARAMGNMGLKNLYLVSPREFPSYEATARAASAEELLNSAIVCDTLAEALTDCVYVIGSTARPRESIWPVKTPEQMAAKLLEETGVKSSSVALVFGQERAGLTNQELDLCNAIVTIPVNPQYPSLNLGAAVMLLCWEIRRQADLPETEQRIVKLIELDPPAPANEMEMFYAHLQAVMSALGFIKFDKPEKLMRKIRQLFFRSSPTSEEVNLLRGILSSVQYNLRKKIK